ncbi:stage II sporulation protein M [Belliella sp. R4-6]|uniref:Stage II sporulation protein M n=1 Tax=Belliella alkalica TaxID=1730871 RepID=A0ABS9VAA2_9BACT|nr:stage II sporulation protein M [Belliella alkalica]MCH7413358.1 stage II sporulation protein M [Belliella alkalica]
MREASFIKRNKDKWVKFENALLSNTPISPLELGDLYVEITDHLSYAQTFYPNSQTHIYLNQLASKSHQKIYKTKKESKGRFIKFYTQEFPAMFYQYLPQLGIAFLIFLVFSIIGAYSAATDAAFVRAIMGDAYVNMTLANIEKGDPMAVYKQMQQMDMFLGITINNIRVALTAFSYGILLGVGTFYILMQNAIMLGSFQYFFYDQGLLWESARTIWVHGTIEISVIIVAGCAGIVLGNSLLFPGTYSRLTSLKRGVKAGLKILISTIPFFIIAGFLEGFITRITDLPDMFNISIIIISLGVILFYYVIYPIQIHKKSN